MGENKMVKENIVIRNYRKSDYEDTLEILKALHEKYDIGLSEAKWKASSGLRQFKPNLKRLTLVAEEDGKVVSMGMIEAKKTSLGEYIGYLDNWATNREYIGKGIGQILADRAIKILKSWGVDKIHINVAYTSEKKLIDVLCKGGGFIPKIIVLEKTFNDEKTKSNY